MKAPPLYKSTNWTSSEHDVVSDDQIRWEHSVGLPSSSYSSEQIERILGFGNGHLIAQLNSHLDSLVDCGGFNGHAVFDFDGEY